MEQSLTNVMARALAERASTLAVQCAQLSEHVTHTGRFAYSGAELAERLSRELHDIARIAGSAH